jgi:nucleotide-binding universal stress UspA family protein
MYKTIVVGSDGSETAGRAVEAAVEMARGWGSSLHVITAYTSGGGGMGEASGAALAGGGGALRHDAAEEVAEREFKRADGVPTTVHAVGGHPADAILDTAQEVGADLIVVGSRGMQGARRFLGSVPNSVAHGANCSVMIVKTD